MSDVATLGLKVDSSQVKGATAALDEFAAAGKGAQVAATGLEKAVKPAANALSQSQQAASAASNAHKGLSTQAMAAQHSIRSMVEQLALGVPPTQALTAQLNHLSFAASGPGGLKAAFTEAAGAFRTFITPTTLIVGGLVAVVAGMGLAATSILRSEIAFDDLAKRADIATQRLHAFESAAAIKGIDTDAFAKGMEKFADETDQARRGLGGLAELFRANGVQAGTLEQNLLHVADMVKNARTEAERYRIVQAAGLPATAEMVRLLSQGSAALKSAADQAVQFAGDDRLVQKAREFEERWNSAWNSFRNVGKSAILDVLSVFQLPSFSQFVNLIGSSAPNGAPLGLNGGTQLTKSAATGADRAATQLTVTPQKKTVLPEDLRAQIGLEQQRIGILGQTASVEEQVRAVENQITLARLGNVHITKAEADNLKNLAREQAIGITQIKSVTDSYRIEAETFGMTTGQAEAYRVVQTRINEAIRNGNPLKAEEIAQLRAEGDALASAAQRVEDMRFASDTISGGLKDFRNALQSGASAWDAFRQAGTNALNRISDKLIDMATSNLVSAAFGGSGGGGFTSIISGIGKIFGVAHTGGVIGSDTLAGRYVHPAYFDDAPRFHTGGVVGMDEVPIIAKQGEGVFTPAQMKALAPAGGQPSVTIVQNNTFNGADPGSEARLRAAMQVTKDQAVKEAVQAVARVKSNQPSYLR